MGMDWMQNVTDLWITCADVLRSHVGDSTFRTTFAGIEPISLDAKTLTLNTPNVLIKERVNQKYLELLEEVIQELTGEDLTVSLTSTPRSENHFATDSGFSTETPAATTSGITSGYPVPSRTSSATRKGTKAASYDSMFPSDPTRSPSPKSYLFHRVIHKCSQR